MRRGGDRRDGYSSNGYSRTSMVDHLENMMRDAATPEEREKVRRFMSEFG